jgi:hypothetical protein
MMVTDDFEGAGGGFELRVVAVMKIEAGALEFA